MSLSVRQVYGCLFMHNVILDVLFCLAQVFFCLQSFLHVPCCIRAWMTVANGWGLSCLPTLVSRQRSPNSKVSALVEVSLHTSSTYRLQLGVSLAVLQRQVECIGHFTCMLCPCWYLSSAATTVGASHPQPHPSQGPGFEHDHRLSDEPDGRYSQRRVDRMQLSLGQVGGLVREVRQDILWVAQWTSSFSKA